MNETGLELLVTAYMEQQFLGQPRQLRGLITPADGLGGFCTLGLFLNEVGCDHLLIPSPIFSASEEMVEAHQLCQQRVSERFQIAREEWLRLRAENDHFDWLTIAAMHHTGVGNESHEEED